MFCRSLFVLFTLGIVLTVLCSSSIYGLWLPPFGILKLFFLHQRVFTSLTVLLLFTDYDYLFGILKLFFLHQRVFTSLTVHFCIYHFTRCTSTMFISIGSLLWFSCPHMFTNLLYTYTLSRKKRIWLDVPKYKMGQIRNEYIICQTRFSLVNILLLYCDLLSFVLLTFWKNG
jgi:hypothetical protein